MIKRIKDVKRIPEIVKFGEGWHARSRYAHIPFDRDISTETVRAAVIFSNQALWTYEVGGKITGFLIAAMCPYLFSKKKYTSDLLFCADQGGAQLFWTIREWAKGNGAMELQMGVTSGIGVADDVGKFYEKNGMQRIGGIYALSL